MNAFSKPTNSVGRCLYLGAAFVICLLILGSCIPGGETIVVIATHPTNPKILYEIGRAHV